MSKITWTTNRHLIHVACVHTMLTSWNTQCEVNSLPTACEIIFTNLCVAINDVFIVMELLTNGVNFSFKKKKEKGVRWISKMKETFKSEWGKEKKMAELCLFGKRKIENRNPIENKQNKIKKKKKLQNMDEEGRQ